MPNLVNNHTGIPFTQIQIQDALIQIKADIENAITNGGTSAKNALIRTQKPIKLIHDALKTELLINGIHPSLINPDISRLKKRFNLSKRILNRPIKLKDKELKIAGYLKTKNQDISVIPRNLEISPASFWNNPTLLNAFPDYIGFELTEATISINVRSQLSSTDKNFDTLYERTFAESLNLHLRCKKMVLSEVYMIIAKEYNEDSAKINQIAFKHADNIEKYIKAFQAITGRTDENDEAYKYERCCLLIVDFSEAIPKIYNSSEELKADGLLSKNSTATMDKLDFINFIPDLLNIYNSRFPNNKFN